MIGKNLEQIRETAALFSKPVRLVLFTADLGCEGCPDMRALGEAIRRESSLVAFETYDLAMDRDKSERYGARRVPSLVIEDGRGRGVLFSGRVEDIFLSVLLDGLQAASAGRTWFPPDILTTLAHLSNQVRIRVFVEADCPLCRPVASTAMGLAFESDLIGTEIIIASDFPDLIRKYAIKTLPKTIFGENLHLDGHVAETEFLEMIFEAEGLHPGADRRCLACGAQSGDILCGTCKKRIQAEALSHKIRDEKLRNLSTS